MIDEIKAKLMDVIAELKELQKGREVSIAITNAEQALMWLEKATDGVSKD